MVAQHDYTALPKPSVWRGLNGNACSHHAGNACLNCKACALAVELGGINKEWYLKNPGAHTHALPVLMTNGYKPGVRTKVKHFITAWRWALGVVYGKV